MSTATTPLIMPYPGLRPFEETDHALFFGREAQVSALLRQLEDHAFVAVLGSSGSGKSSLVRAGLIPAVREGFLLAMTKWRFLVIRPGHQPYQRLIRVLTSPIDSSGENHSAPARDESTTSEESRVLSTLLGNDRGLLTALDESGISADTNVMIVVDQFEELFAFRRAGAGRDDVASRDEVAAFVNTLLCACADPNGRVRVVLTMRSDFVGDCEAFLGLPEAVSRSQFLVPRLDRVQMEDAIIRPGTIKEAGFRPFSFEQGLVNRIINDAGDRPDQLPLMQHALMRTWKLAVRRAKQNGTLVQLMHKDYDDAGGITEALSRHAEDAWKLIEGDQRKEEIVRRLFLLLCDISPDGQITRRRPRVTEVQAVTGADKEELEGLIRLFQEDDRNFLFPRLDHQNASDFLDISHEALLRQWPRFARWLEQERQDASELERLVEQAALHSQKTGDLLSATNLDRIAEWKRRVSVEWARRYVKPEAWENVVAYIEESKKDVRKQAWKKWGLLAAIVIVLVVATAISLVLTFQANSAKAAAQRALTDSFFRTIGPIESLVSLSLDERAALWDLGELASENVQVRETVIDRWFQTEKAVLRGLNNDTRGLRAASGLNVELRKRVMLRLKELAVRLVTALESPQRTDDYRLSSLSKAVVALAARMEPQEAAPLAARLVTAWENPQQTNDYRLSSLSKAVVALAARMEPQEAAPLAARLVTALENPQQTNDYRLSSLGEAVVALAARMEPQEAAPLAARLVTALENPQQTNDYRLSSLGGAVAALAARMEPQEAAPLAARSAQVLVTALENPQQTNDYRLSSLGGAVAALAARMEPQEAAPLAARSAQVLVTALENPQQTNDYRLSSLGGAVAALAARMEPQEAAPLAARLVTALESPQQTNDYRLSSLGEAVVALAARMEPQEAAPLAARLVTALENPQQTDSSSLSSLSKAVVALAARMEPQEAAPLAARLVTAWESPQQTNDYRLSSLGEAVAALAARMEPQEAAPLAARLVTALESPQQTNDYRLSSLGEAVAALAARMEPQEAAPLAARLVTALENPQQTNDYRLSSLGEAVVALAARMEPQEAAPLAARSAQVLVTALENPQQTDSYRLSSLGEAVAALAARMEPQEAAPLAARSAQVLVTALENPQDTYVLQSLGMSLGNHVKFIPSARQATLLLALSNIFLWKVPAARQQGQEAAQEAPKVRKEVTELCQLLSHQELAEVLKWPFTVGEAEKIVLTELERKTGHAFGGDVWKFVEQAQSLGITGLDAPAKRPRIEDK